MQKDNLFIDLQDNLLSEKEYQQIADRENLYILKPIPYENESGFARVYTKGSGGDFAQTKSTVIGVPKYVVLSIFDVMSFFDSELAYYIFTQRCEKKTDIVRNSEKIGFIDVIPQRGGHTAHLIYINSDYLGIKLGDILTTSAAKLFGDDARNQEAISYDAQYPVFAEYSDVYLINGNPKPTDTFANPTTLSTRFGLNCSSYEAVNISTDIVHLGLHNTVDGKHLIPNHSIVGNIVDGNLYLSEKWAQVTQQIHEQGTLCEDKQHSVYVLADSVLGLKPNTIIFTANGHRKIELGDNEIMVVNTGDIYAYLENDKIVTLSDYVLLQPILGNLVNNNGKKAIYVQDITQSGHKRRMVRVLDKEYILALPSQIVATFDN